MWYSTRPGRASRMDRVIYGRRMREVVSLPRACWNVEWLLWWLGGGEYLHAPRQQIFRCRCIFSISCIEIIMYADVRPKKPTVLPDRDVQVRAY